MTLYADGKKTIL